MHGYVASYINRCARCLRRKSQSDQALLLNIEVNQPLELIHLDYLKIEPSKGNVENVLIITDHFSRYAQAFPSKTQTALATAKLLWNNFILHYGFPSKIITELGIGDLVLVKQTAWKGRHKIQDKCETEEYQVVGQPTPGVPVYTVKSVAGGRTGVLHRNLLLPLQGRIRQEEGMRGEGISDSEDEEEGGDGMPKVARAPHGNPRGTTRPKASPSQQREASSKDASADLSGQKPHSLLASPSSLSTCQGMRTAVRMNCT